MLNPGLVIAVGEESCDHDRQSAAQTPTPKRASDDVECARDRIVEHPGPTWCGFRIGKQPIQTNGTDRLVQRTQRPDHRVKENRPPIMTLLAKTSEEHY